MTKQREIFTIRILYFLSISSWIQESLSQTSFFVSGPTNQLAVIGDRVVINCSESSYTPTTPPSIYYPSVQLDPLALSWNYSLNYNASDPTRGRAIIAADCVIVDRTSSYETQMMTSSVCNLVIASVTFNHAGYYTCFSDYDGVNLTSELTVVDSLPLINFNTTEAMPGDALTVSCSLEFNGPQEVDLVLTSASNSTRFLTDPANIPTSKSVTTYRVLMAEEPGIPSFSCSASVPGYKSVPRSFATNTPEIPENLKVTYSDPIRLSYPVNYSTISTDVSSNRTIYVNERIRCVSTCYPPPDYYEWYLQPNFQPGSLRNSSDGWSEPLTVLGFVSSTCTVANTINGISYKASIRPALFVNPRVTVRRVSPMFGPIAGGTLVTIEGDWSEQNLTVFSVTFNDDITQVSCTITKTSPGLIVVLTPSVGESLVELPLAMSLGVSSSSFRFNLPFADVFTYLGDPEILDFYPTDHIVNGGTQMTVVGNNLTSVADPRILIRVEIFRYEANAINTSNSSSQPCQVLTSQEMLCLVPPVDLPPDFPLVGGGTTSVGARRRRATSDEPVETLIGENGRDRAMIYLGFVLDGDLKCRNVKSDECLPDKTFTLTDKPEIDFNKDLLKFDPDSQDTISVKGKHMTRGSRLVDYRVKLGDGSCAVDTLHDNQLSCRPPKREPETVNDYFDICDDHLTVIVHVGFATYIYSCLDYVHPNLPLILGLSIGLGLFGLILIVALIVLLVVKCRGKRNGTHVTSSPVGVEHSPVRGNAFENPDFRKGGESLDSKRRTGSDAAEKQDSGYLELESHSGYLTTIDPNADSQRSPQGYLTPENDYPQGHMRPGNEYSQGYLTLENDYPQGHMKPGNEYSQGYLRPVNEPSGYLQPV